MIGRMSCEIVKERGDIVMAKKAGPVVMRIGIDIKGNVAEISGAPGIKDAHPGGPDPEKPIKVKEVLKGHVVFPWEPNPQKCVTYYYPGGAFTV